MKKHLGFLILILSLHQYCAGQSDSLPPKKLSRFNLFISGGVGLPVGKFSTFQQIPANDMYQNYNLAGEAQTGFSGKIGGRYLLGKHIGIAASLYMTSFTAKKKTSTEIFSQYQYGYGTVSDIGNWMAGGLLLGILYECSTGKFNYGVNLMGGIQMAQSPATEITMGGPNFDPFNSNDLIINKHNQPAMNSSVFAYDVGVFVNYPICRRTSIRLMADYTGAAHHFSGDLNTENTSSYLGSVNHSYSSKPISFKKQITFVSILLGVTLKF